MELLYARKMIKPQGNTGSVLQLLHGDPWLATSCYSWHEIQLGKLNYNSRKTTGLFIRLYPLLNFGSIFALAKKVSLYKSCKIGSDFSYPHGPTIQQTSVRWKDSWTISDNPYDRYHRPKTYVQRGTDSPEELWRFSLRLMRRKWTCLTRWVCTSTGG